MSRITVLYHADPITIGYTLMPLLTSTHRRHFAFTSDLQSTLAGDGNRSLLLVRFGGHFGSSEEARGALERLHQRYERIVYYDDRAATDSIDAKAIDLVDLYYKKQIARDRESYAKPLPEMRRYSAYYAHEKQVHDRGAAGRPAVPAGELEKLRLGWNLGIGIYPRFQRRLKLGRALFRRIPSAMRLVLARPRPVPNSRRCAFVSGRITRSFSRPTLEFHRKVYARAMEGDARFRTGRIPRDDFLRELGRAQATLSPFGYGEVCFRDFEAVLCGSTLIKPSMGYVETWPDVYREGETCEYVDWDASDLVACVDRLLGDEARARRLAENALDVVCDAYRQLDSRVETLIEECAVR